MSTEIASPQRTARRVGTFHWTNRSVLGFAAGRDPVEAMESKARDIALSAMDDGWSGPPFDPIELAQRLRLRVEARGDIPDARTVPRNGGELLLEYNPTRPRGRLRFSIAHEVAHSLFPDCADTIRNRGVKSPGADNWQLEVLCNIGAAELLMPLGSFSDLSGRELSISSVLHLRKEFDVSAEACLIRLVKLAERPCAAFGASMHEDGQYRIDYLIPARGWTCPVPVGHRLPAESSVTEANAIGFTAFGNERWAGANVRVECLGLAPYPGTLTPRVVGLVQPVGDADFHRSELTEVSGDALEPRGNGAKIVAHVVPNTSTLWGGRGFAFHVRKRFPEVWRRFRDEAVGGSGTTSAGTIHIAKVQPDLLFVQMIAQRGIGPSNTPRVSYSALAKCLGEVRTLAERLNASVHMPRIGTGHGGGNWQLIRELILEELIEKQVKTTIYRLPTAI